MLQESTKIYPIKLILSNKITILKKNVKGLIDPQGEFITNDQFFLYTMAAMFL